MNVVFVSRRSGLRLGRGGDCAMEWAAANAASGAAEWSESEAHASSADADASAAADAANADTSVIQYEHCVRYEQCFQCRRQ